MNIIKLLSCINYEKQINVNKSEKADIILIN